MRYSHRGIRYLQGELAAANIHNEGAKNCGHCRLSGDLCTDGITQAVDTTPMSYISKQTGPRDSDGFKQLSKYLDTKNSFITFKFFIVTCQFLF